MEKALQSNIFKIYAMGCCQAFQLVTPVFVPLLMGHGLTMSEIMQTQAVFALVLAALEVPSGYFADCVGRRIALIIGSVIALLGYVVLSTAHSFFDFIVFECLMGVAYSLFSGTDMALLFDTQMALSKMRAKSSSRVTVGRLVAIASIAEAVAAVVASLTLSGLLFVSIDSAARFNSLLLLQIISAIPPVWLTWRMVEAPRKIAMGAHAQAAKHVLQALLFENPVVLRIAAATLVYGLMALFIFWLYQPYWAQHDIPVQYFGYVWAGHCIARSLSAHWAAALEQRIGSGGMLLLIFLLPVLGLLAMLVLDGWPAVMALLLFPFGRGISTVLFFDGLNQRLEAHYRATINSLVSLGTRAIFIIFGPVLGWLIDAHGIATAVQILLLVFTPLLLFQLANLQRFLLKDKHKSQRDTVVTSDL